MGKAWIDNSQRKSKCNLEIKKEGQNNMNNNQLVTTKVWEFIQVLKFWWIWTWGVEKKTNQ